MDNPLLPGPSHRGRISVRHDFAASRLSITAWARRLALPLFEAFSVVFGPWRATLSPLPIETSATAFRRGRMRMPTTRG